MHGSHGVCALLDMTRGEVATCIDRLNPALKAVVAVMPRCFLGNQNIQAILSDAEWLVKPVRVSAS